MIKIAESIDHGPLQSPKIGHRQAILRQGNTETVGWISNERGVKVGSRVEIKSRTGLWTVTEIGSVFNG